jgi:hypothetical protein
MTGRYGLASRIPRKPFDLLPDIAAQAGGQSFCRACIQLRGVNSKVEERQKMARQILQFIAVTSGGRAFDIDFPLHPQTQSASAVSDLVTRLLEAISEHAKGRADVSDGDILQALAMTSAIRGRMLDGDQSQIADLNRLLYDRASEAASAAQSYAAARA